MYLSEKDPKLVLNLTKCVRNRRMIIKQDANDQEAAKISIGN